MMMWLVPHVIAKSDWLFPPWMEVKKTIQMDPRPIMALVVILAALLIFIWVRSQLRHHGQMRLIWRRIDEICKARDLTHEEQTALKAALRRVPTRRLADAIETEGYFETYVVPRLIRKRNTNTASEIQAKLFHNGTKETVVAEKIHAHPADTEANTRMLSFGQGVRLHLEGHHGRRHAVVINVGPGDFIVAFPEDSTHPEATPNPGDSVEGVYETHASAFSFHSVVVEATPGLVGACRIAHTDNVTALDHNGDSTIPFQRGCRLTSLPGQAVAEVSKRLLDTHPNQTEEREAAVRDIGLRGCVVITDATPRMSVGDLLHLSIQLKEGATPLACLAEVDEVAPGDKERVELHLTFLGLEEAVRDALALAVAHEQRKTGSASAKPHRIT